MALPLPSPARCSAETMRQEMNLANAVLAIDIKPATAKPSIGAICMAVEKRFSLSRLGPSLLAPSTQISSFTFPCPKR